MIVLAGADLVLAEGIRSPATLIIEGDRIVDVGAGVTIPAGAPHTLRTGDESLFALTIFAPPER